MSFGSLSISRLALTPGAGGGFAPWQLYESGDILLWYDPSDLTTMFKDVAGTQPVTADGDAVALMFDKGQWGGKTLAQVLAAQPELVSNPGDPFTTTTGYTANPAESVLSVSSGRLRVESVTPGAYGRAVIAVPTEVGKTYIFDPDAYAGTGTPFVYVGISAGTSGYLAFNPTNGPRCFTATTTIAYITLFSNTAVGPAYAEYGNISLKNIPGHHRTQTTGPSMPKYKTDGSLHWLLYDGTDDGDATTSFAWGADEVEASIGLEMSSDAAAAVLMEFGPSATSNNGSFAIFAPPSVSSATIASYSRGTIGLSAAGSTGATPATVVGGIRAKISTDVNAVQVNGAETINSSDQGSGNYGTYALYFGRRAGASLPLNGKEYQTIIRNRLFSAAERARVLAFNAVKTGITL